MSGLSAPRSIFGVHSFTPYSRTNGQFYGTVKVLKNSSLAMTGSQVEQMGGASKFPWNVEDGAIKVEMSLKFGQYEDFLFQLFHGNTPTPNAAETSGSVTAIANKLNASVVASTGIASVLVKSGSEADVKFCKYLAIATDATHVDVYASSDIDFSRGTDLAFISSAMKITASPLAIATTTAVDIPGTGLKFTGGAGTIGMTTGDTATFSSRPINTQSMDVVIGGTSNQTFPEFGSIVIAQKRGNAEMFECDVYRCKGSGFPIGFDQFAWAEAEVKIAAFYDSVRDGVFALRHVSPSS